MVGAFALGIGFVSAWVLGNIITVFIMTRKRTMKALVKFSTRVTNEMMKSMSNIG
jgi:hypothetical protein